MIQALELDGFSIARIQILVDQHATPPARNRKAYSKQGDKLNPPAETFFRCL